MALCDDPYLVSWRLYCSRSWRRKFTSSSWLLCRDELDFVVTKPSSSRCNELNSGHLSGIGYVYARLFGLCRQFPAWSLRATSFKGWRLCGRFCTVLSVYEVLVMWTSIGIRQILEQKTLRGVVQLSSANGYFAENCSNDKRTCSSQILVRSSHRWRNYAAFCPSFHALA